nr:hypothetical protein [Tanacetum cinerariifolium]
MGGDGIVGGEGVLKAKSNGVTDESVRVMSIDDEYNGDELRLGAIAKEDDVPLVDGVLNGALGAFSDMGLCFGDELLKLRFKKMPWKCLRLKINEDDDDLKIRIRSHFIKKKLCKIGIAGSEDRPPMLAPGNYVQWKYRIKRYTDTKPNHELIYYCLENPPYKLDWKDIEVPVSEGSPITTTARIHETYKNVLQEIRDQLNAEAEAKIYKPTNNNLRTSSNTSRANQDNSPRINRSVGYENQRIGNVAGARENVGSSVVQKSGIQCYNCKEFGHVARECDPAPSYIYKYKYKRKVNVII